MQGFHISRVWMILFVVTALLSQQFLKVSAVYTVNQTCAQYGTGFMVDQNSCESFAYCENGKFVGTRRCPDGYIYNSQRNMCDLPSHEACSISNVASVCRYAPEGSYISDSTNCKRFCQCINKAAVCNECTGGQVFDVKQTRCVWNSQSTTKCLADSICRLIPNGKFVGDPANCGQSNVCNNGLSTPANCPKNTYYNKDIGMCQEQNPCTGPTPAGIGPGVLKPLPNDADVCKRAKGPFPAFLPDEKTCMGYFVCTSADEVGVWMKCNKGLHFDGVRCVTPLSFACAYDRCANINQQFVGAIGTGCHNFKICGNETSQGQSSGYSNYVGLPCSNNRFFNEFTQTCDEKSPASNNYKLCP